MAARNQAKVHLRAYIMIQLSDTLLDEIRNRLVEAIHPLAIYLYGSYAYGIPGENSDIDLLIVVDAPKQQTLQFMTHAYLALQGLKVPVEINVVSSESFNRRRHWKASVERDAVEKGVPLYAA